MNADQFTKLALSFDNTVASPHFDRTAFKVLNKRIFATLHAATNTANLKLSPIDQSVYCLVNKDTIYPVYNKWGQKGWTTFVLDKLEDQLILDALRVAYNQIFKTDS